MMRKELDNFYLYLENKNYSKNTIESYKKDLKQFEFFCKNININSIDYNFIRKYSPK